MHATPSHYHHHADLLTCNEHIRWKIPEACVNACRVPIFCRECVYDVVILSVTFLIFFAIYLYIYIYNTHLIIIIKSDASTFSIVVICSLVVCLRWLYHYMLSVSYIYMYVYNLGTTGSCFFLLLCNLMMCANNQVHYGLVVVLICLNITLLHYHHYADVFQWFWNSNTLAGYILSKCVSKIKSTLNYLSCNIWGYVYSANLFILWWLCICTLFYYHHQIGSMTHLPLFRVWASKSLTTLTLGSSKIN